MLNVPAGLGGPSQRVATWLDSGVFVYTPDGFNPDINMADAWPTRSEIEGQLAIDGHIHDDCDGHAFAACYALADLGVKARVILCYDETGAYHAVAEDADGWVLDNRQPGRLMTWADLEGIGYRPDLMSGFFEFGEVGQWHRVAP